MYISMFLPEHRRRLADDYSTTLRFFRVVYTRACGDRLYNPSYCVMVASADSGMWQVCLPVVLMARVELALVRTGF